MPVPPTREKILENIEGLYAVATCQGKWGIALRAKELQGRMLGFFKPGPLPQPARMSDLTEEELLNLIEHLEKSESLLKKTTPPQEG